MNLLKTLKNKGKGSGPLSGRTLSVGRHTVRVDALLSDSGGSAFIYRAVDAATGEAFALKHFHLGGDPDAVRGVANEVAAMKALAGCPDVVRLRAAAVAGDAEAFLLLDLCADSLAGRLAARGPGAPPLSLPAALGVALPVARALAATHALGLVHRDVKAENVLLASTALPQRWVLCDYGSAAPPAAPATAAELAAEEERLRRHTTPAYRAPEVWDLYSRVPVGPPADVWALGVLLHLLLAGRLPFGAGDEARLAVLNGGYAALPRGGGGGGGGGEPAAEALVAAMLAPDAGARPTAADVVARLQALAARAAPDLSRPLPRPAAAAAAGAGPLAAGAAAAAAAAPGDDALPPVIRFEGSLQLGAPPAAPAAVATRAGSGSGSGWATFGDFGESPTAAAAPPAQQQRQAQQQREALAQQFVAFEVIGTPEPSPPPPPPSAAAPPPTAPALEAELSAMRENCQALEQLLEESRRDAAALRGQVAELQRELARRDAAAATAAPPARPQSAHGDFLLNGAPQPPPRARVGVPGRDIAAFALLDPLGE